MPAKLTSTEQLFIILASCSKDKNHHSDKSFWAVFACSTLYFAIQKLLNLLIKSFTDPLSWSLWMKSCVLPFKWKLSNKVYNGPICIEWLYNMTFSFLVILILVDKLRRMTPLWDTFQIVEWKKHATNCFTGCVNRKYIKRWGLISIKSYTTMCLSGTLEANIAFFLKNLPQTISLSDNVYWVQSHFMMPIESACKGQPLVAYCRVSVIIIK